LDDKDDELNMGEEVNIHNANQVWKHLWKNYLEIWFSWIFFWSHPFRIQGRVRGKISRVIHHWTWSSCFLPRTGSNDFPRDL
jgi:hypothetical protein